MGLTVKQKNEIRQLLTGTLRAKLKKYERETTAMPFLVKLMQDVEKVAAYSFIHSVATTLGASIYEKASCIIVRDVSEECFTQYDLGGVISRNQHRVIGDIVNDLSEGRREPNPAAEKREVLGAGSERAKSQKADRLADFYMLRDGVEHYIEIKTAKPNKDIFKITKTKILEWAARKRSAKARYIMALPYNPYHPAPYGRFTMQNLFQAGEDFLVGRDYWNYLGGDGTFEDLLSLFDEVGRELKAEIARKIESVSARAEFNPPPEKAG